MYIIMSQFDGRHPSYAFLIMKLYSLLLRSMLHLFYLSQTHHISQKRFKLDGDIVSFS